MHASLPMYDFPAVRGATDRFWTAIREALGEGPEELSREGDLWDNWQRPDLLLSQSCGLPYRARLHGKVTIVGTPDYGLPGCAPGEYNSVFVARADDPRSTLQAFEGARFAANSFMSQSGWAAPIMHARAAGVAFGDIVKTGGHMGSAQAVAAGEADIACLDAQSWRYIPDDIAFDGDLKAIETTVGTPATPFITALSQDAGRIFTAIETAIDALSDDDRHALCLKGIVSITPEAYCAVPTPPPPSSPPQR